MATRREILINSKPILVASGLHMQESKTKQKMSAVSQNLFLFPFLLPTTRYACNVNPSHIWSTLPVTHFLKTICASLKAYSHPSVSLSHNPCLHVHQDRSLQFFTITNASNSGHNMSQSRAISHFPILCFHLSFMLLTKRLASDNRAIASFSFYLLLHKTCVLRKSVVTLPLLFILSVRCVTYPCSHSSIHQILLS